MTAADSAVFAEQVEGWGYTALWVPELMARDPLVTCAWLLAKTTRLNLATGMANIYVRDPFAMANAQYALAEQSGGRFLLGIGPSHKPFVEGALGHRYESPAGKVRDYLAAMAKVPYQGPQPPEKPKTILGALGSNMIALAGAHADGVHSFNVTPDHTAEARRIMGPGKLLCPEQKVLLETDATKARAAARQALGLSLTLPNYRNSYLRQGFIAEDLENGGSDRLVDGIVAWGDETAIRERIRQHWDAGADHVCIHAVAPEDQNTNDVLKLLAPG